MHVIPSIAQSHFHLLRKHLRFLLRICSPVVEYAEKLGVIVAIEPVCRHIVNNAKRARKVLDAIDSPESSDHL